MNQSLIAVSFLTAVALCAAPVYVDLKDAKGVPVGRATITEAKKGGVLVHLRVKGLPVGEHAAHIHMAAKCEGPDFTSAGGHFNPEMKKHGLDSEFGPHAGDMVNFNVIGKKGKADVVLVNQHVNLGTDNHSLFSNGGTALVIHAMKDDMKTDPAGAAGPRIACGTITK